MTANKLVSHALYTLILVLLVALAVSVFRSGRDGVGGALLVFLALFAFVFAWRGAYPYRYLFPSLLAFGAFVMLPLVYTVYIAFTNYSAMNLQTLGSVQRLIAGETDVDVNQAYGFKLYAEGADPDRAYQMVLTRTATESGSNVVHVYATAAFKLADAAATVPAAEQADGAAAPAGAPLKLPDIIKIRERLKHITLGLPGDTKLSMLNLSTYAPQVPVWRFDGQTGEFTSLKTGAKLVRDDHTGFYRDAQGAKVGPGYRVFIGWRNFGRIFTDPAIRAPFVRVFIWTVVFALFSVLLTFALGFLLAVLLEWKALAGRHLLRMMLILPYAVPAFISILIFKGLFNPQFGEINAMLAGLFGLRPDWTTDPVLAKTMILIVNLWLGYPYMMILCTGILQSVPADIYEASAIDGGGPFSDLFRLTLPLVLPPLKPLLIASFAFNFNNFLLIQLLTAGAPPIVGAATPVGYTDILVTYTFNLAFRDAGANFGFASAIAAIIFLMVSALSYINFRAAMRTDERRY